MSDSTSVKVPQIDSTPSEDGTVQGIKIGIPKEYACEGMSSEILSCWTEIANLLEKEGANISEVCAHIFTILL
jgi:aspartyl-tRNA(Asn)/glutamyl-tRNA(Gln) amidotransferase subunit A